LTPDHLERLQEITSTCRRLLDEVRSGNLADFDGFSEQFDREYEALALVPSESLDEQSKIIFRRKLRELERVRGHLFDELKGTHVDLSKRLTDISKGQIGLDAYKSTLKGVQRGVRHAEG
jgi:hypothetical protein